MFSVRMTWRFAAYPTRGAGPTGLAGSSDQCIAKAACRAGFKLPLGLKTAALGMSLVVSALLTASVLRLPELHWLAWISFLPLFVVVRSVRPRAAALAGGFWGACLLLFYTAASTSAVDTVGAGAGPSVALLALLIVIPAVYVGLAALSTRAIWFKLIILALGWTLIEIVLHLQNPSRSHNGLLTGPAGEAPYLHWLARLFGYAASAFVVACVNASLVTVLSAGRLSFPAGISLDISPNMVGWFPPQIVPAIQSWMLSRAHPRAPPIHSAAVS